MSLRTSTCAARIKITRREDREPTAGRACRRAHDHQKRQNHARKLGQRSKFSVQKPVVVMTDETENAAWWTAAWKLRYIGRMFAVMIAMEVRMMPTYHRSSVFLSARSELFFCSREEIDREVHAEQRHEHRCDRLRISAVAPKESALIAKPPVPAVAKALQSESKSGMPPAR